VNIFMPGKEIRCFNISSVEHHTILQGFSNMISSIFFQYMFAKLNIC
jgi:hypothetical protein